MALNLNAKDHEKVIDLKHNPKAETPHLFSTQITVNMVEKLYVAYNQVITIYISSVTFFNADIILSPIGAQAMSRER